ncbi:abc1 family protein group 11 [hydrocarbon metagenome]|uniref:Abc1 family protein group 11 n=1 Tax=hydrocarbon metagenome TaxID=938273 RepID=A0A0W8FE11_9ZZZZ
MDAVAPVGCARDELAEEDHVLSRIPHREVVVLHPFQFRLEPDEIVEVGGKEGAGAERSPAVDELHHRPGDAVAVQRARAAPDLVEHEQAARRRVVQDVCQLQHLHHERALPAREIVKRPDPGEDPVHDPDRRVRRRHKAPHLGHDADQGDGAHVGRFPGHVRPGDDQDLVAFAVEQGVVRDEGAGQAPLHHRVPPLPDRDPVAAIQHRADVAAPRRDLGKRRRDVEQPDSTGEPLEVGDGRRKGGDHLRIDLALERRHPLVGGRDLRLLLPELGRRVALAVRRRLLPLVFGRDQVEVGLRRLDIVAKYPVVADF